MSIRSNAARTALVALLAAGLAALLVVLLFPGKGETAALASPSPIVPLAADWDFDDESSTSDEQPGIVLYDRVVSTPASANTMFITFSGTGDQHDSARTLMKCWVDGVACSGGDWVVLQYYDDFDFHDNNINYTWCKAISPASKNRHVQLNLASSNEGGRVYVEQMHFYVSAAFLPHGCSEIEAGSGGGDSITGAGHHG